MLTAALSTIARTWKQPKRPMAAAGTRKLRCTHTMEYYAATERNETQPHAETRVDLESVTQKEVSQREETKCRVSSVQSLRCVRLFVTP